MNTSQTVYKVIGNVMRLGSLGEAIYQEVETVISAESPWEARLHATRALGQIAITSVTALLAKPYGNNGIDYANHD